MNRDKTYAAAGSVIAMIIVFLILWFINMPFFQNDNILDEGVMVSFGDSFDGGGNNPEAEEVFTPPAESTSPARTQNLPSQQDLMTQKSPSTLKVTEKNDQKKNNSQAINQQQQAEQQRLAEQRRREQAAANEANNTMSGLFGNNGGSGSGSTKGDTHQGNPAGHGNSGGNSWSLNGRDLLGSLVRPSYSSNEEGKITVRIRVDANGNVTTATVSTPTTISDSGTRDGAVAAAKKTRFSGGSGPVIGTITYYYRLN